MTGSSTVRRRPDGLVGLIDDRDWLAEFPPESQPAARLLAGATTLPIIARASPLSPRAASRARALKRPRRSILLMASAMALLLISAGATIAGLWIRGARPLAVSEWPVSPPPLFSQPSAVPHPRLASALEVQPTPELTSEPAAAPAPAAPVASTRALTAPPVATAESAAVATNTAAPGASDESAILSVLDRYRLALGTLNPGSVRAVAFDNCRIDVEGVQAEAICAGRVSLVTRGGPQERNIQSRNWRFTLVHGRDAWRIQTVDGR